MLWAFRFLAALNVALLAAAFLYHSSGEDPAGAGMRLGFATLYAIALAVVLLLYRLVKTPWVQVPLLIVLTVPLLSILYGVWLSF